GVNNYGNRSIAPKAVSVVPGAAVKTNVAGHVRVVRNHAARHGNGVTHICRDKPLNLLTIDPGGARVNRGKIALGVTLHPLVENHQTIFGKGDSVALDEFEQLRARAMRRVLVQADEELDKSLVVIRAFLNKAEDDAAQGWRRCLIID